MTKKIGGCCLSMLLVLLIALSGAAVAPAAELPARLGEIVYANPRGDGVDEASSRPIADGDLVKCLSRSAIVRLEGGRVLKLDTNTAAVFDGNPSGRIGVRVLSGRVSMIGRGGRLLDAGAGSVFEVPAEAEDSATDEALLWQTARSEPARRTGRRSR